MIKEARKALADATGAVAFLPERIQPPIALITANDPYVIQNTYCQYEANFVITVVVAKATSEQATDALDDYIEETLDALPNDVSFEKVGPPFILEWNGASYLSAKVFIVSTI